MRRRLFAFGLALLFAAAPVLGVVCLMDCDEPPKSIACHETASSSSEAPRVRDTGHACNHDRAANRAALAAGTTVREAVAGALVSLAMPGIAHVAAAADVRATMEDMHGPPGPSGRRVSSRTTVLRI